MYNMYVCMYVRMYNMYVCTICTYVCTICMYVCTSMYLCMCGLSGIVGLSLPFTGFAGSWLCLEGELLDPSAVSVSYERNPIEVRMYILYVHMCVCIMNVCTYVLYVLYVLYVCMYVRMYIRICTYVCTYVCTVCTYVRMYLFTYVCPIRHPKSAKHTARHPQMYINRVKMNK